MFIARTVQFACPSLPSLPATASSGAEVFAIHGEAPETYYRHIEAVCNKHPQVTLDDGADLISVLHGSRSDQLPEILGGTENTTTGAIRVGDAVKA